MKKSEYPIAVIDEQEDQLEELQDAFRRVGEHCTTIQYDPSYRDEPYSGIELLFLDVNLSPGAGRDDNALYSVLEDAIKTYIAADNGPYVLIFWTTRPELVEGFKNFVSRDRDSQVYKHRPIYIDTLPKEDFEANTRQTLTAILNKPIVKLVFSLHNNLQKASKAALDELLNCISLPEVWGDDNDYLGELKKIFSKIAITSVGKHNAAIIPDKAIFEVVGREVLYHLVKNSGNEWKTYLEIDKPKIEELEKLLYKDWQYKLNTVFHVEASFLGKMDRGTVLTGTDRVFAGFLGKELAAWYKEEFNWEKTEEDEFEIVPVAIEISPACDYAQGNSRLYKYVLGLCRISDKCPSKSIEGGKTAPFKKKDCHNILPTFLIDNKYYKIVIAHNYVVGLKPGNAKQLKQLFSLRGDIVTQISNLVSGYCSRIGLINVNES